jgi:hypothetical protein
MYEIFCPSCSGEILTEYQEIPMIVAAYTVTLIAFPYSALPQDQNFSLFTIPEGKSPWV